MLVIQRPVADLCKQGDAHSVLRTWVNRTSAIFLQLDEMCQGVACLLKKKITKNCAGAENSGAYKEEGQIKGFVRVEFASVVVLRQAQPSRES